MRPLWLKRSFWRGLWGLMGIVLVGCGLAAAQVAMDGSDAEGAFHLIQVDRANLELREPRKDLPCTVTRVKATVGFDLRLHAGYEVAIPLKDLAGPEDLLTIIFRVTPERAKQEPTYFTQRIRVPPIDEDAKGEAYLHGGFDLGEGKYHVDWLMRDRAERVCSDYWDLEAALPERDREMDLILPPGHVQASDPEPFRAEPPVERLEGVPPLSVKVLVNFAPQRAHSAVLLPLDWSALVSILRSLSRDPRVGKFSIVAFNLQEQRVIFRQDDTARIDFPALGEALESLNLGTVDVQRLSQKNGETQFLADLIQRETAGMNSPDALIFAGPKALLDRNVPEEELREVGPVSYPVFYMNYNLNPSAIPWRDAIGNVVKFLKGTEYTISRPHDLWAAVTEMVSRIVKSKDQRLTAAAPSQ